MAHGNRWSGLKMIEPGKGEVFVPLDFEPYQPPKKRPWWRPIVELAETLLLAGLIFLGINAVTARIRVESISMLPTLQPGTFVIVNKLAYFGGEVERGDVVVFNLPQDSQQRYIKRVIGLPGEEVRVSGGNVYVDGNRLAEPYLDVATQRSGTWTVPDGSLFVMGDNRNNSSDSRVWGAVPVHDVIGKASVIYWPPQEWGLLNNVAFAATD